MKVVNYIGKFFVENNIDCVFGVSGANIEDLFFHLITETDVKVVIVKNEYNAIMMAAGYYLKHKKIAAVLTTSGAGIMNAIPALCETYSSLFPMFVIAGQPPQSFEGKGAFQDTSGVNGSINLQNILSECTLETIKVSGIENELPSIMTSLYHKSLMYKRPVAILVNKDSFEKVLEEPKIELESETKCTKLKDYKIDEIRELLSGDEDKVIVLGEELIHQYNKLEILRFATEVNAKIVVVPIARGLIDSRDGRFLGMIGVMGHDKALNALESSKHIIFLGVKFDLLTRLGSNILNPGRKMIFIGEETSFLYYENLVTFSMNPSEFINLFNSKECIDLFNSKECITAECVEEPIVYESVANINLTFRNSVDVFNQFITPENDLYVDAGNTGAFFTHFLKTYGEANFYISLGMAGMGNSIPVAIGASMFDENRSYVFIGDGSFLIHGMEIHTALEQKLAITFVILNNNSHGMCSSREEIFFENVTEINNFQEVKFGEGFGKMFKKLQAFDLDTTQELMQVLKKTKETKETVLISLNINDRTIPPFKSFEKQGA